MATIKEDYVSFEVAKLLKEKGFDQNCATYYLDGRVWRHYHGEVIPKGKQIYAAPTQAMAMKWLREVHNIMVSPYALSLGYYFEIFDLTNRDVTGCKPLYKVGIPYKVDVLSTYEKSCEAAIKYCLNNLI
jgi:hypothetical protein